MSRFVFVRDLPDCCVAGRRARSLLDATGSVHHQVLAVALYHGPSPMWRQVSDSTDSASSPVRCGSRTRSAHVLGKTVLGFPVQQSQPGAGWLHAGEDRKGKTLQIAGASLCFLERANMCAGRSRRGAAATSQPEIFGLCAGVSLFSQAAVSSIQALTICGASRKSKLPWIVTCCRSRRGSGSWKGMEVQTFLKLLP